MIGAVAGDSGWLATARSEENDKGMDDKRMTSVEVQAQWGRLEILWACCLWRGVNRLPKKGAGTSRQSLLVGIQLSRLGASPLFRGRMIDSDEVYGQTQGCFRSVPFRQFLQPGD